MRIRRLPAPILVFVRPQASGNIGALSRVMSNFGCTELRIVGGLPTSNDNPHAEEFSKMDWALACRGEDILKRTQHFKDLREAVADLDLAIGSSGRKDQFERGYGRPKVDVQTALVGAAEYSYTLADTMKWALVLGPEDDGLMAEEAALCQKLVHINTVDENPSINIAMCAGMILYHWHFFNTQQNQKAVPAERGAYLPTGETLATLGDKEKWLDYVLETLKPTQFFKYPDIEGAKARMRRLTQSVNIPRSELLMWFEVFYQLQAWGNKKFGSRTFLDS